MSRKDRILEELKVQQSIEGNSADLALVRKILDQVQTSSQLRTLVDIRHHRYGELSYETHRFYYPSQVLRNLEAMFT